MLSEILAPDTSAINRNKVTGEVQMYGLIAQIRDETGCAILMVSHDQHLVMSKTDQVLWLNHHLCCSGKPESVSQHPEYLALFGDKTESIAVYTHHHDHVHDLDGGCEGCMHNSQEILKSQTKYRKGVSVYLLSHDGIKAHGLYDDIFISMVYFIWNSCNILLSQYKIAWTQF